jgi:hypothetical protein
MAKLENFEGGDQTASLAPAQQPSPPTQPAQQALDPAVQQQFDELSRAMNAAAGQQPAPQPTQPAPVDPRTFGVPDAIEQTGNYDPAKEQRALQMADQIPDPVQRLKVKSQLKQEYANDRIMDGAVAQQRQSQVNQMTGKYLNALKALRDSDMPWDQKQASFKKAMEAMWSDPRMQYGETQAKFEKFAEGFMGIEDTTDFGPGYSKMIDGLDKGTLRNAEQIMHMENVGALTARGASVGIERINQLHKPDERLKVQLENGAIKTGTMTAYGKFDENSQFPNEKPGPRQLSKADDISRAITLELMAAGDDMKEVQRITDPKHVAEIADRVYPPDQRNYDWVTRGQQGTPFAIPPTISGDERYQNEAKWILGAPPTIGTLQGEGLRGAWSAVVDRLRQDPTPGRIAAFNARYPGKDAEHIIQALGPYVAQTAPGGAPPVAEPTDSSAMGLWLQKHGGAYFR